MKICTSCGMPMGEKKDFPLGDESLDYCIHCANPDGTMHSFEKRLEGATAFLMRTQGLEQTVAREMALEQLKLMPAWQAHFA